MRERTAQQGGPPPLGMHVIIGPDTPTKIANLVDALMAATLAPVETICHSPRPDTAFSKAAPIARVRAH